MRTKYVGLPYSDDHAFDVELVDKIINEIKRTNLTAEHLQFSHPVVVLVMCKFFNIMMSYGYVLASFGRSYTIRCQKVTPFWVKHLWLTTLGVYLLAQCCRKSSNIVYLIGFPVFWPQQIINLALRKAWVVLILYIQLEALLMSMLPEVHRYVYILSTYLRPLIKWIMLLYQINE